MSSLMKHTFAGGELAPDLDGRTDYQKYPTGAALLENFWVERYGGISNRPGMRFITPTPNDNDGAFVPFKFSSTQSYAIEFTAGVMRVMRDGNVVLTSRVNAAVKWTASGSGTDEYYMELAAGGDPSFVGAELVEEDGVDMQEGTIGALTASQWVVGDNDTLGFSTLYVRLSDGADPDSKAAGYIQSDYQLDHSFSLLQIQEMNNEQSLDTVWLTHWDFPPFALIRSADDSWAIGEYSFTPNIQPPFSLVANESVSPGGTTRNALYRVAAIAEGGEESEPTAETTQATPYPWNSVSTFNVQLFWNALVSSGFQWTASASGTGEYYCEVNGGGDPSLTEPEAVYEAKAEMTSGTAGSLVVNTWDWADNDSLGYSTVYVRVTGDVDPDTLTDGYLSYKLATESEYNIYKDIRGYSGWIGTTQTPWYMDDNIDPDISLSYIERPNPFDAADDYPRTVALFQQRLAFASTENDPQKVWLSRAGILNDFGIRKPLSADDSISGTIASGGLEDIRHLSSGDKLLALSGEGSWTIDHGNNSDALTPANIQFRPQEFDGAAEFTPPIRIGRDVLFVQSDDKHIRALNFRLEVGGYQSNDLTLLVPHMFEGKSIVDWTYQRFPQSIVWITLSDGTGLMLTYLKEQELFAFSRLNTDGLIKAMGTQFGESEDLVYFIVERTIDGQTRRYTEYIGDRYFESIEDAFFVDAGVSYSGTPVSTISNLWHLEGKQVAVLGDGMMVSDPNNSPTTALTVTDGAIDLGVTYSDIHIGLPYTANMQSLRIDADGGETIQGKHKTIMRTNLRLKDSVVDKMGPDENNLNPIKQRQFEDWREATRAKTGDLEHPMTLKWTTEGQVYYRQSTALPVTILALINEIKVGNR